MIYGRFVPLLEVLRAPPSLFGRLCDYFKARIKRIDARKLWTGAPSTDESKFGACLEDLATGACAEQAILFRLLALTRTLLLLLAI